MTAFFILSLGIILVMGISIVIMLLSLSKQGDERRNFIIDKAIKKTFITIITVLMLYIVKDFYVFFIKGLNPNGIEPFSFLSVISIAFALDLLFTKKQYGN